MKRLLIEIIVLAVCAIAAFVAGMETGHRKGYDKAWSDCKFDAKQQISLTAGQEFWDWYGSDKATICKRRSLFQ